MTDAKLNACPECGTVVAALGPIPPRDLPASCPACGSPVDSWTYIGGVSR